MLVDLSDLNDLIQTNQNNQLIVHKSIQNLIQFVK